jgi:hypothetical protein
VFGAKRKGVTGRPLRHLQPREREMVGALGAYTQRREKKGGPVMDDVWLGGDCSMRRSGSSGSLRSAVPGQWEKERESTLTGRSGQRTGPVSNGFKNNPNLIQTCPKLI